MKEGDNKAVAFEKGLKGLVNRLKGRENQPQTGKVNQSVWTDLNELLQDKKLNEKVVQDVNHHSETTYAGLLKKYLKESLGFKKEREKIEALKKEQEYILNAIKEASKVLGEKKLSDILKISDTSKQASKKSYVAAIRNAYEEALLGNKEDLINLQKEQEKASQKKQEAEQKKQGLEALEGALGEYVSAIEKENGAEVLEQYEEFVSKLKKAKIPLKDLGISEPVVGQQMQLRAGINNDPNELFASSISQQSRSQVEKLILDHLINVELQNVESFNEVIQEQKNVSKLSESRLSQEESDGDYPYLNLSTIRGSKVDDKRASRSSAESDFSLYLDLQKSTSQLELPGKSQFVNSEGKPWNFGNISDQLGDSQYSQNPQMMAKGESIYGSHQVTQGQDQDKDKELQSEERVRSQSGGSKGDSEEQLMQQPFGNLGSKGKGDSSNPWNEVKGDSSSLPQTTGNYVKKMSLPKPKEAMTIEEFKKQIVEKLKNEYKDKKGSGYQLSVDAINVGYKSDEELQAAIASGEKIKVGFNDKFIKKGKGSGMLNWKKICKKDSEKILNEIGEKSKIGGQSEIKGGGQQKSSLKTLMQKSGLRDVQSEVKGEYDDKMRTYDQIASYLSSKSEDKDVQNLDQKSLVSGISKIIDAGSKVRTGSKVGASLKDQQLTKSIKQQKSLEQVPQSQK